MISIFFWVFKAGQGFQLIDTMNPLNALPIQQKFLIHFDQKKSLHLSCFNRYLNHSKRIGKLMLEGS